MITQIYEIQTQQEAEKCIELGIDHIGSVLLSEEEWKHPTIKDVIHATNGTQTKNSLIPLFNTKEILYEVIDYYQPHFLHFCEGLTDDLGNRIELNPIIQLQSDLKEKFPEIKLIRSIPIPQNGQVPADYPTFEMAREIEEVSDWFLIDTWLGKEPVDGFIGITGITADRELSKQLVIESEIPVILAGGLGPDNVFDAILEVIPNGVDSCTHTNRIDADGKPLRFEKDFAKVEKFMNEVRKAENKLNQKKNKLLKKLEEKKEQLKDRELALPAHSIRPHQIQIIEELEEKVADLEREIKAFSRI